MSSRSLQVLGVVALATFVLSGCALCPTAIGKWGPCPTSWGKTGTSVVAKKVKLPAAEGVAASAGGRVAEPGVVISAQPDVSAWPAYNRAGYRTIVNFRTAAEGADAERGPVVSNGMQYFNIPVEGAHVTVGDADALAKIVAGTANGKILLHCTSGNRAAAVWAVYLARHRGMSPDEAIAQGDAAGITKAKVREGALRAMGAQ